MSLVWKNWQERRAKRIGAAIDRWIWRFYLVLLIGATAGAAVQSLVWQAHTLVWNPQVVAMLLVLIVSYAVFAVEIAGFYAGDWLGRRLRPLVGFVGIVWFGIVVLWLVFAPPWLGLQRMIDVTVVVFSAIYGVFNWAGFSFRNTWYAGS